MIFDLRSTEALVALLNRAGIGQRKALLHAVTHSSQALPKDVDAWQEELHWASREIKEWRNQGIETVGFFDADYPPALRALSDPPPVVWIRGNLDGFRQKSLAIVGTREPTKFGIEAATAVSQAAVERGWVVVSGLARGIDTVAHRVALEQNGRTIAVMAGGLDSISPAENKKLAQQIADSDGALLAEVPPGVRPRAGNFISRDRLQSGLSRAVFICQTGTSGGSLHTAGFAVTQGRPIFVPAPSSPHSEKSEGLRLLMNMPGSYLVTMIREWREKRWLPGQLSRSPVATGFRREKLGSVMDWLEESQTFEFSDEDRFPAVPPVNQERLELGV